MWVVEQIGLKKRNYAGKNELMEITAILAIWCFTPLSNVEKKRAIFASSYVMGSQHCIGGEGDF